MTIKSAENSQINTIRRALNRNSNPVVLGDASSNVQYQDAPSSGMVWARRMQANGTYGPPFLVRGSTLSSSNTPGIPVELGIDKQKYQHVEGVDFASLQSLNVNPTQYGAVDPNTNNPAFVNQQFITTAYAQIVEGTLKVAIRGWLIIVASVVYKLEGQVDFTGNVPTAGNHRLAVISRKNDYSTLEVQYSTAKPDGIPLDISDLQEAITATTATNVFLWAFSLADAQTVLTENNRWMDLRGLINELSGGTGTVTSVAAGTGLTASPSPIVGAGTISLAVPVSAANGGTGIASPTAHDLLVANGASAMNLLAPGAKGNTIVSNGTDFATLPVGTDGQGKIAQAAQTDGVYWRDVLYPKNELINGGFSLNSRGAISPGATASYSDDSYSLDQWIILTQTGSVTDARSVAAPGASAGGGFSGQINQAQVTAQRFGRAQIIEGYVSHQYRSVPLRFQGQIRITNSQPVRFAILEWTGTNDAPTSDVVNDWTSSTYTPGNFFLASNLTVTVTDHITPAANTWTPFSITGTPGGVNNLIVFVWTEGTVAQNVQLNMAQCMLVSGIDPVPWVDPDPAVESIRAQRFLKVFYSANTVTTEILSGNMFSATHAHFTHITPVDFFAVPTLTATASDWQAVNSAANDCTAVSLAASSTVQSVLLDFTVTANINTPVHLRGDGSGDRYLILSAEM